MALRKRLFCNAKPTLLPCKTAAFGMQNSRFCNALITRWLCSSYACEKYLHFYYLLPSVERVLFAYETRSEGGVGVMEMDNEVSAKTIASDYEFYYKQPYFEQKNKEKLVFYSKFSYL